MKKLKTKLSKKTLAIALAGILACSFIGTAALVDHLSNEATADITVEGPPVELEAREGTSGTWGGGFTFTDAFYGTETSIFQIKVTKLAEHNHDKAANYGDYGPQIYGTLQAEIYCSDGISTGIQEFDEVRIKFWCNEIGYTSDVFSLDDFTVTRINNNRVRIEGDTEILWDQWGYYGQFEIDWNQYATGNYTITMQIV